MTITLGKVSERIEDKIPNYILETYPLFGKFLKNYYESLESKYQSLDLIDNLLEYYNIQNYSPKDLVESTVLTSKLDLSLDTINVISTVGFPKTNGYIKIDNEIIFYREKTSTSFTGCSRGSSAITSYNRSSGEVTFSDSVAANHNKNAAVVNLAYIFTKEFITRFKTEILPDLPKDLPSDLNLRTFFKNIKEFYLSKGTPRSHKFLFRILYNQKYIKLKVENAAAAPKIRINVFGGRIGTDDQNNLGYEIINDDIPGQKPTSNFGYNLEPSSYPLVRVEGSGERAKVIVNNIIDSPYGGRIPPNGLTIVDRGRNYKGQVNLVVYEKEFVQEQKVIGQISGAYGYVKYWNAGTGELTLYNTNGVFSPGETLEGVRKLKSDQIPRRKIKQLERKILSYDIYGNPSEYIDIEPIEIYTVDPIIEYPYDNVLRPSASKFETREILKCEYVTSTNGPDDLISIENSEGLFLIQDEDDEHDAGVCIPSVQLNIINIDKVYDDKLGKIIFDINTTERGITENIFLPSETTVTQTVGSTATVINVDSTVGFPARNGIIKIGPETIRYGSKTINQFLDCTREYVDYFGNKTYKPVSGHLPGSDVLMIGRYNTKVNKNIWYLLKINLDNTGTNFALVRIISVPGKVIIDDGGSLFTNSTFVEKEDYTEFSNPIHTTWNYTPGGKGVGALFEDEAKKYVYIASSGTTPYTTTQTRTSVDQKHIKRIPKNKEAYDVIKNPSINQRGIGLTNDGIEINSYTGNKITFGRIESLNIVNNGTNYVLPQRTNEKLPNLKIVGKINNGTTTTRVINTTTRKLVSVYASFISVSLDGIPESSLTFAGTVAINDQKVSISVTRNALDVTGKDAILRAEVVGGKIAKIIVVDPGKYYTKTPTVRIVGGGINVTIPANNIVMAGPVGVYIDPARYLPYTKEQVTSPDFNPFTYKTLSLTVTEAGSVYTENPTVTLDNGSGASGFVEIFDNQVRSVIIEKEGESYYVPPLVQFIGDGKNAQGVAVIDANGKVIDVDIINGGENYTIPPIVRFISRGSSFSTKSVVSTWTPVLPETLGSRVDDYGGYVFNYSDSPLVTTSQVPETKSFPEYLQLKATTKLHQRLDKNVILPFFPSNFSFTGNESAFIGYTFLGGNVTKYFEVGDTVYIDLVYGIRTAEVYKQSSWNNNPNADNYYWVFYEPNHGLTTGNRIDINFPTAMNAAGIPDLANRIAYVLDSNYFFISLYGIPSVTRNIVNNAPDSEITPGLTAQYTLTTTRITATVLSVSSNFLYLKLPTSYPLSLFTSNQQLVIPTQKHSSIIGWAYDGNPIYGRFGYTDSITTDLNSRATLQTSSYRVKYGEFIDERTGEPYTIAVPAYRPSIYVIGSLVEDYVFDPKFGTLDQYNGKFCVTPDFPNGTYAYFATDFYPYFIGPLFRNKVDSYNLKQTYLNSSIPSKLKRIKSNDTDYAYFPKSNNLSNITRADVTQFYQGGVEKIIVDYPGYKYKSGDVIISNNDGTDGSGLNAVVDEVSGDIVRTYVTNLNTTQVSPDKLYLNTSNSEIILEHQNNHMLESGDKVTLERIKESVDFVDTKYIGDRRYYTGTINADGTITGLNTISGLQVGATIFESGSEFIDGAKVVSIDGLTKITITPSEFYTNPSIINPITFTTDKSYYFYDSTFSTEKGSSITVYENNKYTFTYKKFKYTGYLLYDSGAGKTFYFDYQYALNPNDNFDWRFVKPRSINQKVVTNYIGDGTTTVTVTVPSTNGFLVGDLFDISGATGSETLKLNGAWQIVDILSPTTFRIDIFTSLASGTYTTNLGNVGIVTYYGDILFGSSLIGSLADSSTYKTPYDATNFITGQSYYIRSLTDFGGYVRFYVGNPNTNQSTGLSYRELPEYFLPLGDTSSPFAGKAIETPSFYITSFDLASKSLYFTEDNAGQFLYLNRNSFLIDNHEVYIKPNTKDSTLPNVYLQIRDEILERATQYFTLDFENEIFEGTYPIEKIDSKKFKITKSIPEEYTNTYIGPYDITSSISADGFITVPQNIISKLKRGMGVKILSGTGKVRNQVTVTANITENSQYIENIVPGNDLLNSVYTTDLNVISYTSDGSDLITVTVLSTSGFGTGHLITIDGAGTSGSEESKLNGSWPIHSVINSTEFKIVVTNPIQIGTYSSNIGTAVRTTLYSRYVYGDGIPDGARISYDTGSKKYRLISPRFTNPVLLATKSLVNTTLQITEYYIAIATVEIPGSRIRLNYTFSNTPGDVVIRINKVLQVNTTPRTYSLNSINWYTRSSTVSGPIRTTKIIDGGKGYKKLPEITNVISANGYGAKLQTDSDTIGKIKKVEYITVGDFYGNDRTIDFDLQSDIVLKLKNNFEVSSVTILNRGENYYVEPNIVVKEDTPLTSLAGIYEPSIQFKTTIQSGKLQTVEVLSGGNFLIDTPELLVDASGTGGSGAIVRANLSRSILNKDSFIYIKKVTDAVSYITSVNTDSNTVIFETPHNFSSNDLVLYECTGLPLITDPPDVFANHTQFYVQIVDNYTIRLTLQPQSGIVDIIPGSFINDKNLHKISKIPVFETVAVAQVVDYNATNSTVQVREISGNITARDSFGNYIWETAYLFSEKDIPFATISKASRSKIRFKSNFSSVLKSRFTNQVGFLSEATQKITDSNYYQIYSYLIGFNTNVKEWYDLIYNNTHSVGNKLFGKHIIETNQTVYQNTQGIIKNIIGFNLTLKNILDLRLDIANVSQQILYLNEVAPSTLVPGAVLIGGTSDAIGKVDRLINNIVYVTSKNGIQFTNGEVVYYYKPQYLFSPRVKTDTLNSLIVYNGVLQDPNTAYSVEDNKLSLAFPVNNRDKIFIIQLSSFISNYFEDYLPIISEPWDFAGDLKQVTKLFKSEIPPKDVKDIIVYRNMVGDGTDRIVLQRQSETVNISNSLKSKLIVSVNGVVLDPNLFTIVNGNVVVLTANTFPENAPIFAMFVDALTKLSFSKIDDYTYRITNLSNRTVRRSSLVIVANGAVQNTTDSEVEQAKITIAGQFITFDEPITSTELLHGWLINNKCYSENLDTSIYEERFVSTSLNISRDKYIRRTFESNKEINYDDKYQQVKRKLIPGTAYSGTYSGTPSVSGTYIYGNETQFVTTYPEQSTSFVEILNDISTEFNGSETSFELRSPNSEITFLNEFGFRDSEGNLLDPQPSPSSNLTTTGFVLNDHEKLLVTINDSPLVYNEDYTFSIDPFGLTQINFTIPPTSGSKCCLLYFYSSYNAKDIVVAKDYFDSSRKTFFLSENGVPVFVRSQGDVFAIRNGVLQPFTSDFLSVQQNTISFVEPPEPSDDIKLLYFRKLLLTGNTLRDPNNYILDRPGYIDGTRNTFTLTKNGYPLLTKNVNNLLIFRFNGIYQYNSNSFTLSGNSITFIDTPQVNEPFFAMAFNSSVQVDELQFVQFTSNSLKLTSYRNLDVNRQTLLIIVNGVVQQYNAQIQSWTWDTEVPDNVPDSRFFTIVNYISDDGDFIDYSNYDLFTSPNILPSGEYVVLFSDNIDVEKDDIKIYYIPFAISLDAITTGTTGGSNSEIDERTANTSFDVYYQSFSYAVEKEDSILVNVNGITQNPGVSYKIEKTTLSSVVQTDYNSLAENATFGYSTKISDSGNYKLIGAPLYSTGTVGNDAGVIKFYRKDQNSWNPIAGLFIPLNRRGASGTPVAFGYSLDLTEDAERIIIGSPLWSQIQGVEVGAVSFYNRIVSSTGSVSLVESAFFTAPVVNGARFGHRVAIDKFGRIAAVSAPYDDNGIATKSGAVFIYRYDEETSRWVYDRRITTRFPEINENFGISLDISADSSILAVGSRNKVYIYNYFENIWYEEDQLILPDVDIYDNFGYSVSISEDGNKIVVGSPKDSSTNTIESPVFDYLGNISEDWEIFGTEDLIGGELNSTVFLSSGSAYVFKRTGTNLTKFSWILEQKLQPPVPEFDQDFGFSVDINGGGDRVVIGAPNSRDSVNQGTEGKVFVYDFNSSTSTWNLSQTISNDGSLLNDRFGHAVSMSSSGNSLLISAPYDDNSWGVDSGTIYYYAGSKINFVDGVTNLSNIIITDYNRMNLCKLDSFDERMNGINTKFRLIRNKIPFTRWRNTSDILVSINGVLRTPYVDYYVENGYINFLQNPPNDLTDEIYIIAMYNNQLLRLENLSDGTTKVDRIIDARTIKLSPSSGHTQGNITFKLADDITETSYSGFLSTDGYVTGISDTSSMTEGSVVQRTFGTGRFYSGPSNVFAFDSTAMGELGSQNRDIIDDSLIVQVNGVIQTYNNGFAYNTNSSLRLDSALDTDPYGPASNIFAIKFSSLVVLDGINNGFDGSNKIFPLFYNNKNFVPTGTVEDDSVPSPRNLLVFKNDRLLEPLQEYNLTGPIKSKIEFTVAPLATDKFIIRNVGLFYQLDKITTGFNGSTKIFNMKYSGQDYYPNALISRPRDYENQILVIKDGYIQNPLVDYYIENNRIIFATAPSSNTTEIMIYDFFGTKEDVAVVDRIENIEIGDTIRLSGDDKVRTVTKVISPTVIQTSSYTGITKGTGLAVSTTVSSGKIVNATVTSVGIDYPEKIVLNAVGSGAGGQIIVKDPSYTQGGRVSTSNLEIIDSGFNYSTNPTLRLTRPIELVKTNMFSSSYVRRLYKMRSSATPTSTSISLNNVSGLPTSDIYIEIVSTKGSTPAGSGAILKPYVYKGSIVRVDIVDKGTGYDIENTVLNVIGGGGTGAILKPVISSLGVFNSVTIIDGGIGYDYYSVIIGKETVYYTIANSSNNRLEQCTRPNAGNLPGSLYVIYDQQL